jgi:hypothetical protein
MPEQAFAAHSEAGGQKYPNGVEKTGDQGGNAGNF